MQTKSSAKKFRLLAPYLPSGDQPKVIEEITESLQSGNREQTILGVTGSGKTFMIANIVNNLQKPTLVIAHNKTLAAQLAEEFKRFFPDNAVHYFVSYYDYYQPESYLPRSDTFIEKQTQINEEIERLRNACTQALLTRKDVLIVASVSCIYGLGNPKDFMDLKVDMQVGDNYNMQKLIRRLVDLQFERTNLDLKSGYFRIVGDVLELLPTSEEMGYRFSFFGDELESIEIFEIITKDIQEILQNYSIFPATQYVTTKDKIDEAIPKIEADMWERYKFFTDNNLPLNAQRIKDRTLNDLDMLKETGFCSGIENYSSYFDGRINGEPPSTLINYFPSDGLTFIDESHMTLPQIGAMFAGDQSRKNTLIEFGFRLPSAKNNRPMTKKEFFENTNQLIYVSATPSPWDLGIGEFEK